LPDPACTLGQQALSASAAGATALILDLIGPDDAYDIGSGSDASAAAGLPVFSLGTGPAEVWGVAIDPDTGIVYASDMRTGLWVIRPVGDAAPSD
jgi:hypothetical protein